MTDEQLKEILPESVAENVRAHLREAIQAEAAVDYSISTFSQV